MCAGDYCKARRSDRLLRPETRDHGRVIGRAFDAPRLHVDAAAGKPGQQLAMHQDEIDAQAVVPAECALAVVPPAERLLRLFEVPEGVHQPKFGDSRQRGALLGTHVHAAHPGRRVVHVAIFGRDVEVAQHDEPGMVRRLELAASA